jgi:hypothetical protein
VRTLALVCLAAVVLDAAPQATIIDSGSTNSAGMRITVDRDGARSIILSRGALSHGADSSAQRVNLPKPMCRRFLRDLAAAGPLDRLPARHCIKSVSFGSSLFVEFNGLRSPDLSCPNGPDGSALALKNDAAEILRAARAR